MTRVTGRPWSGLYRAGRLLEEAAVVLELRRRDVQRLCVHEPPHPFRAGRRRQRARVRVEGRRVGGGGEGGLQEVEEGPLTRTGGGLGGRGEVRPGEGAKEV